MHHVTCIYFHIAHAARNVRQSEPRLLYAELGTAVATTVKASVVKKVVEVYAACAIQAAELVKKRLDNGQGADGAAEVVVLQKGASALHAQGIAARNAALKDVLAAKWLPP